MEDRLYGFQQEGKDLDRRGGLLAAAAAVEEDFSVPVHPEADEVGDTATISMHGNALRRRRV
jgi:hypothetical protein